MGSLRGADFTSEIIAVPIAVFLIVLCAALLPSVQRTRARQGAVLLGLSLVCHGLRFVAPRDKAVDRFLLFSGTFFLLASMARSAVLLVLDVFVERRHARPNPRIFRDLSTATVYLLAGLIALRSVGVEPGSILTTSALLTAVIGLAMQDTLGNLVSGLALQMQRPFDVGDWIEVDDGKQAGRVTEVTWRATTVMTLDQVEVIVPNAALAKAAIRNYSRPSKVSRRRIAVSVTYAAAPDEVHETLVQAAGEVSGVLGSPPPFARTKSFGETAIEYELLFFIDDFSKAPRIEGAVRDRVYYALSRQKLEIPYPTRALVATTAVDPAREIESDKARHATALASVDFLGSLPKDSIDLLAARAQTRLYGPGEIIARKGNPGRELYIVERGCAGIEIEEPPDGARTTEVAELTKGQYFGEMGLLTGQPLTATVRAKTVCRLVIIDRDPFAQVIAQHPEIVDGFGAALASRQTLLEAAALRRSPAGELLASPEPRQATVAPGPRATEPPEARSRRLIGQIRGLFKLG
jgi:small-conductance mechanosensitive channel/CRP-like cAMP-binding protein